ncbi:MAG: hypothetical protein GY855_01075 [candidate division Zixibacteria bacterium]|nr:hypothetical protein [candidate division Zixibacteria bacterium]
MPKKRHKTEKEVKPGSISKINTWWFIGIYALLIILLFRDFIFSGKMLFGTDTIEAQVMFRTFLVNFVKTYHTLPLWNPYLYGGIPYVDAMHGDTFFPLSFVQFINPLYKSMGWKLVITAFFGGVIVFNYFKNLDFSPLISFLGGLFYLLNAFTISLIYAGHDGRMYISVLFPLLLLAIDRIFKKADIISLFIWSVVFSLLVLANHPQLAYFAMWGVGAYTVYSIVKMLREKVSITWIAKASAIIIIGIVIGLAGSIVQLLPQYIYVNKYSPRAEGEKDYQYSVSWSNHPEETMSLLNPKFSGDSIGGQDTYWGRNPFKLNSDYAGFIPLLLAIVAIVYVRKSNIYFFAGIAVAAILYGLADHTPFFKLFYYLVPQVKSFRAASTIMFLYVFSIVYMAIFGIRYICDNIKDKKISEKISKLLLYCSIAVSAITLLFTIAPDSMLGIYKSIFYSDIDPAKLRIQTQAVSSIQGGFWMITVFCWLVFLLKYLFSKGTVTRTVFIFGIAVLSLIDLWSVSSRFISTIDYDRIFRKSGIVDFLKKQDGDFRVFSFPKTFSNLNYLGVYGIEQVLGHHGNQPRQYDDFSRRVWLESARTQEQFQQRYSQFLYGRRIDVLNTKYFAASFPLNDFKYETVFNYGNTHLMENKMVLPRARVVYNYDVVPNTDSALLAFEKEDFDYRNSVILNHEPDLEINKDTLDFSIAEIYDDVVNEFKVKSINSLPGILVLSESYYPAWKATVNGTEREILMADGNFMAIPVEAGNNIISIRYDSVFYNVSSVLTVMTWVMYFVAGIYFVIRKRFSKTDK